MIKIISLSFMLFSSVVNAQDTIRIKLAGEGTNQSSWKIGGNTGTTPDTNFLGSTDSAGLMFKTNSIQSGYIDIVHNNTSLGQASLIGNLSGFQNTALGYFVLKGNTTGNYNTAVGGSSGNNNTTGVQNTFLGWNTGSGITTGSYNTILGANVTGLAPTLSKNIVIADGAGNRRINVDSAGNVAIGTTDAKGYKLAVNGSSIFERVKVKPFINWPDYVFEDRYVLPPLKDIESFIKKNNHLPEVSSSDEIEKNGIDLGDNQTILLKKVEELTLYVIEQNKIAEHQQEQINKLKQQLGRLETALLKKN
jgi:uncharacterized coiled-coil protein SlyX